MSAADRINRVVDEIADKAASRGFVRGYFCAVAAALREEGMPTTLVRTLYEAGGDPMQADSEDIALFREHGLLK
jgi:hypothetical protein